MVLKQFKAPRTSAFDSFAIDSWKWHLRHPIMSVQTLFRCFGFAWQRATRGWCVSDVWDIDTWLARTMPSMLMYLAEHHRSYPGFEDVDTPEKWEEILADMAVKLWACCESNNAFGNAYEYDWGAMIRRRVKEKASSDMTPEEKDLHDKFIAEDQRIDKVREQYKDEAFDLMKKYFYSLWD